MYAQSSVVISGIGYRYRQTQYYSVSGIGCLSGIVLTLLSGPWSGCVKRLISADLMTALRLLLSCDYE